MAAFMDLIKKAHVEQESDYEAERRKIFDMYIK